MMFEKHFLWTSTVCFLFFFLVWKRSSSETATVEHFSSLQFKNIRVLVSKTHTGWTVLPANCHLCGCYLYNPESETTPTALIETESKMWHLILNRWEICAIWKLSNQHSQKPFPARKKEIRDRLLYTLFPLLMFPIADPSPPFLSSIPYDALCPLNVKN